MTMMTITTPAYVKPCGNCGETNCPDCGTYSLLPPAPLPPRLNDIHLPPADSSLLPQPPVCIPELEEQMAAHLADLLHRERELEAEYLRGYQEGYAAARAEFRGD